METVIRTLDRVVCAAFFFLSLLFLLFCVVDFQEEPLPPRQFVTWDGPSQRAKGTRQC